MNSPQIKRFEDLDCWNRSRELTNLIYNLTLRNTFSSDKSFIDQIRRASISIMNNIALDLKYITKEEFDKAFSLSVSCSQITWGLIKNLKKRIDWKANILIFTLFTTALLVLKCF